jgi:hypothetical protein
VRPRALAVLRLMISSNLVGCSIGRSAALAPLRILVTNVALRRQIARMSARYAAIDLADVPRRAYYPASRRSER